MNRGCCLGCLGILLIAFVAFFGGLYYVLQEADVFTEAPPINVIESLPEHPVLALHIDPNTPALTAIFSQALETDLIFQFLPRTIALALAPNRSYNLSELVLAMNTRRFGGGLDWLSQHVWPQETWEWFPHQRLTFVGEERRGLWSVRSEIPIPTESQETVEQWWQDSPRTPLQFETGHLLELFLDNQDGGLMLALEPMLVEQQTDPDEIVVMKAPFDLESGGRLPGLFRRLRHLRLMADMPEKDLITLSLRAQTRDAEAAESLLFFLFTLRDTAYRALVEEDIRLEGQFQLEGSEVRGDFKISHFHDQAVKHLSFFFQQ